MDPFWRAAFMITTMAVAIPTGAKIFNWLMTLWGGSLVMKTHTLWSLGFLITFTLGGISGMFFPVAGLDTHFHDSYFVVAHFHYVFIGGTVFALFSGIYYWYPKATGRKLNETLGLWHFLIGFASYNAAFWPMHALGIQGMPRRTHSYTVESGFAEYNMAITIFAFIFGLSQLLPSGTSSTPERTEKRQVRTHGAVGHLNGRPLHHHLRLPSTSFQHNVT